MGIIVSQDVKVAGFSATLSDNAATGNTSLFITGTNVQKDQRKYMGR
jgi:hypothetical protein